MKIRENIFVEEDPSQTCRNYPTSEFQDWPACSWFEFDPGMAARWLGLGNNTASAFQYANDKWERDYKEKESEGKRVTEREQEQEKESES